MSAQLPGEEELLADVRAALPADQALYLVGGAVRDRLLQQETHDLDFVLPGDALRAARMVADRLGAAYFPLHDDPATGRVVLIRGELSRLTLDFAALRGADLEADLRARDFTINALALDLSAPDNVIDPLGGAADLQARRLRACSETAFQSDPLRILRAVRLATAFPLHIEASTLAWLKAAVPGLAGISAERLRDEIVRILAGPRTWTALQFLEITGALPVLFPELPPLQGLQQPAPHASDAWTHTLRTLRRLDMILGVLGEVYDEDASAEWVMGLAVGKLGRFRTQIAAHLAEQPVAERPLRSLLFLAALYHDAGKPQARQEDPQGRVRFNDHPQIGAELVSRRARQLRFSNQEQERLATIVHHHMRPLFLAQTGKPPSRRAVYRFFRATGPAGVDISLLSLADTLATYNPPVPEAVWARQTDVVRSLLEAWWEKAETAVDPAPLVNGRDLIHDLGLIPGPQVGQLLRSLHEAQACGQVRTRQEALEHARRLLREEPPSPTTP